MKTASSSSTPSGGGATRTHRGALTPGGLGHRCTTICAPPPYLAEGAGVEPTGAVRSDSFRDCLACPSPTFLDASGGTRTLILAKSHSFTGCCLADSASDARL